MISAPPQTVGELLHRSYASLAMAHAAITRGDRKYGRLHFGIRKRLLDGLQAGTMNIGSLVRDERRKMILPKACCYCGVEESLTLDHLWPRYRGGTDSGDNIVWACKSCNSSKGAKDLMEWMRQRNEFPALLILRRHLKLAILHCEDHGLMDMPVDGSPSDLPFSVSDVPTRFPSPYRLVLWKGPGGGGWPVADEEDAASSGNSTVGERITTEQRYEDLAKEAVAVKRAGNVERAIELLREAISLQEREEGGLRIDWGMRLGMYMQAAGHAEQGWSQLEALKQKVAEQVSLDVGLMLRSRIEHKQRLLLQRDGRNLEAVEWGVLSALSWAHGLYVQGRIEELHDFRAYAALEKHVLPLLKKAKIAECLADAAAIVAKHIDRLPDSNLEVARAEIRAVTDGGAATRNGVA